MNYTLLEGDCLELLKTLADNSVDAVVTDLAVGIAAEHLVCADLLLLGHRAFLADQNCPYDVAVDAGDKLVKIQVKATRAPRAVPQRDGYFPAYQWFVRRAGKGGARLYSESDFDLLALVALDSRRIAYLPPSFKARTIHIRTHGNSGSPIHGGKTGKTFEQYPFSKALAEVAG